MAPSPLVVVKRLMTLPMLPSSSFFFISVIYSSFSTAMALLSDDDDDDNESISWLAYFSNSSSVLLGDFVSSTRILTSSSIAAGPWQLFVHNNYDKDKN